MKILKQRKQNLEDLLSYSISSETESVDTFCTKQINRGSEILESKYQIEKAEHTKTERNLNEINAKLEMQFMKNEANFLFSHNLEKADISYKLVMELQQIEETLDDLLTISSMSIRKKVKKILFLRDRCRILYDEMRINYNKYDYQLFQRAKNMKEVTDYLATDYLGRIPECNFITTTDFIDIANEETKEIPTNITGLDECIVKDVIFYGHFATTGYLEPSCKFDYDTGMHIYAKNIVPKKVFEEYDICGYHFCDETMTRYIEPGVYRIEKGNTIGIEVKELKKEL